MPNTEPNKSDQNLATVDLYVRLSLVEERSRKLEENFKSFQAEFERDFKSIDEKLDSIIEIKQKLDGSWKALALVASIIFVATSVMTWIIDRWQAIKDAII